MTVQSISAILTFLAVLALGIVFLRIWLNAHERRDFAPVQSHAYRIRAIGFWILLLVGIPVSVWLLRVHPYAAAAETPQVVNVTAGQWYWDLDLAEVRAGSPVDFYVTSIDVNHGFGLYDEGGRLVTQVQAMPGYINRLSHTFAEPGTYQIMCLEYCGLVHHDMVTELVVSPNEGGDHG